MGLGTNDPLDVVPEDFWGNIRANLVSLERVHGENVHFQRLKRFIEGGEKCPLMTSGYPCLLEVDGVELSILRGEEASSIRQKIANFVAELMLKMPAMPNHPRQAESQQERTPREEPETPTIEELSHKKRVLYDLIITSFNRNELSRAFPQYKNGLPGGNASISAIMQAFVGMVVTSGDIYKSWFWTVLLDARPAKRAEIESVMRLFGVSSLSSTPTPTWQPAPRGRRRAPAPVRPPVVPAPVAPRIQSCSPPPVPRPVIPPILSGYGETESEREARLRPELIELIRIYPVQELIEHFNLESRIPGSDPVRIKIEKLADLLIEDCLVYQPDFREKFVAFAAARGVKVSGQGDIRRLMNKFSPKRLG